jgi:hypothetical protein
LTIYNKKGPENLAPRAFLFLLFIPSVLIDPRLRRDDNSGMSVTPAKAGSPEKDLSVNRE